VTRRLITFVALCLFAGLIFAPSAKAQSNGFDQQHAAVARLGCNSPSLVPISQEPLQWRLLAPAICIHRTTQVIISPVDIVAAHMKGFFWCVAWSQKPSTPLGAVLGLITAEKFCAPRAWYYVRVIT
jgi:hypothetical protein